MRSTSDLEVSMVEGKGNTTIYKYLTEYDTKDHFLLCSSLVSITDTVVTAMDF